jgi:hypothetical protein
MQGKIPTASDWNDWGERQRRTYHNEAARVFKMLFLKP